MGYFVYLKAVSCENKIKIQCVISNCSNGLWRNMKCMSNRTNEPTACPNLATRKSSSKMSCMKAVRCVVEVGLLGLHCYFLKHLCFSESHSGSWKRKLFHIFSLSFACHEYFSRNILMFLAGCVKSAAARLGLHITTEAHFTKKVLSPLCSAEPDHRISWTSQVVLIFREGWEEPHRVLR